MLLTTLLQQSMFIDIYFLNKGKNRKKKLKAIPEEAILWIEEKKTVEMILITNYIKAVLIKLNVWYVKSQNNKEPHKTRLNCIK